MKKIFLFSFVFTIAFVSGCAGSNQTFIGEEKARSIALSHAGVDADGAKYIRSTLDNDDGRKVYDVEFYLEDLQQSQVYLHHQN